MVSIIGQKFPVARDKLSIDAMVFKSEIEPLGFEK
jgi:hypothetical protein